MSSQDTGGGGSACPGDSGSPLVTWDDKNGGWTLIGLLSNGARSCFRGMPEVYTKVADYLKWIHKTMEKHDRLADVRERNRFMFGNMFGGILSDFFGHMIGANQENAVNDRLTYW